MTQQAPVLESDTVQRQASANGGAMTPPDSTHQRPQSEHIKTHHDPAKKKHFSKSVGKKQKDQSIKALAIKKASPMSASNKEANRQAKGS